jgi:hypothetical protein
MKKNKKKLTEVSISELKQLIGTWGERVERFLSAEDILKLARGEANMIKYNALENVQHIEQILQPYGACIILYEVAPNMGHWTTVFKDKKGTLEFFDPYGLQIDEQLSHLPAPYCHSAPHLTRLLVDAVSRGYKVTYNPWHFQTRNAPDVSTCGRWVGARLFLRRHLTLPEFKKYFFKPQQRVSDYVITYFTNKVLGK